MKESPEYLQLVIDRNKAYAKQKDLENKWKWLRGDAAEIAHLLWSEAYGKYSALETQRAKMARRDFK